MRISDWSSDVCSSDLVIVAKLRLAAGRAVGDPEGALASAKTGDRARAAGIGLAALRFHRRGIGARLADPLPVERQRHGVSDAQAIGPVAGIDRRGREVAR